MLIKSPTDFALYAVTKNVVFRNKEELEAYSVQNIDKVIRWVCEEVLNTHKDTLKSNNLTWKQVKPDVIVRCRIIFINSL